MMYSKERTVKLMTAKVTGRVKGAYSNIETTEISVLNKVQEDKIPLFKEVWEIPDNKRKKADHSEKRSNSINEKVSIPKEVFKGNSIQKEREFFLGERSAISTEKIPDQKKGNPETQKGKDILNLNNVQKEQKIDAANFFSNENADREDNDSDNDNDNKEIAFFTEPKSVKRKTQRHIFAFQAITAVTVCLIMLLMKLFAPELYNNLHLYYTRLFQW